MTQITSFLSHLLNGNVSLITFSLHKNSLMEAFCGKIFHRTAKNNEGDYGYQL